ncbi:MAG TPA: ROK family protein [Acidimicrobiales bacterium]|nr:ROK family protein [Acidimicrobiales bacterium]
MTPGSRATAPAEGVVIGIDIGGTKVMGVRVGVGPDGGLDADVGLDADAGLDAATGKAGEVPVALAEVKVPTPQRGSEVVQRIAEVVGALTPDGERPAAIGVGIPGLVDVGGVLRFSPHLPGLVGIPIAEHLAGLAPGARVWVGNDATAAGWAEHLFGSGRGYTDQLMVTLGTGIGGGIVAGGRLTEGVHRYAGELGHMVIDPHGPLCPCGKQGCWERFASGSGLGLLGREAAVAGQAEAVVRLAGGDPEAVRGEHVTTAAGLGDPEARAIMGRFGWWLALGLANLTNLLDPGVIVIGGGVIDAGEVLLGPTRLAFAELVEAGAQRSDVAILPAALGPRAGAIGSGLLAAGQSAEVR